MSFTRVSSALLLSLLLLAACDGTPATPDAGDTVDAGPPDSGPPDAGPPLACSETTPVDGVLGDTVSVMFDTAMTETRPRDLGLTCGNAEAELRWAPEEVVELHVPGTGPVAVDLDTVFPMDTDPGFNTVLQVRTQCEQVPQGIFPPTCFDDVSQTEFRSRGSFMATGGQTYFIIVTGFSHPPADQGTVDRGHVRLDITLHDNAPPTITSGTLILAGNDSLVGAIGNDPDGDAMGVALNFYDAAGLLDIYGDGEATEDGDVFVVFFDPPSTTPDYEGQAIVPGAQVNLAGYLRAVGATHASFRVFDSAYATSDPLDVDITEADVGYGGACDASHACRPEMTCVSGVCDAAGAVRTACNNAIDLGALPDGVAVTRTGSTVGGVYGNIAPSADCVPDPNGGLGAEAIYSVTVPPGITADLVATTDVAGTGTTDTILYLRGACPDSGSELACNDDRGAMNRHSALTASDLGPGTYYLFVESYAGGGGPHAIQVTLTQSGTIEADGGSGDLDGGVAPDGGAAADAGTMADAGTGMDAGLDGGT